MKTVLIVEDDSAIRTPLSMYLERSGYRACGVANGLEVLPFLRNGGADIVILDINLPGKDGLSVCRELRSEFRTPVIMLSARSGEEDKVRAFEYGADDYVSKPFSPRELVARIGTVLKRSETAAPALPAEPETLADLRVGPVFLEGANFRAAAAGDDLRLTKTEFLLLHRLASQAGTVVTRATMMKEAFGYENYLYDRTIDTHVKNLRKKLAGAVLIETVRGIGYRLTVG